MPRREVAGFVRRRLHGLVVWEATLAGKQYTNPLAPVQRFTFFKYTMTYDRVLQLVNARGPAR